MYEKNIISEKEMTNYMAVNNRLLSTVMLPAYEALSDALFLLEDTGVNPNGLAHYPDGSRKCVPAFKESASRMALHWLLTFSAE